MYVPTHFAEHDPAKLHAFIEQHSFATLVSYTEGQPVASHLPLLLDESRQRLIGHMARANDQWQTAAEHRVLAIFHGPHAYISPTWYQAANVVPTWNYVAVHVTGTLHLVEDRDRLRDIVERLVTVYEQHQPQPWTIASQDSTFIDRMLNAIVGFEIAIERIEGKWKLNQNHPPERREKVVRALQQSGTPDAVNIALLMGKREKS